MSELAKGLSDVERIEKLQGELEATDPHKVSTEVYALAMVAQAVLEVALQLAKSRNLQIAIANTTGDH